MTQEHDNAEAPEDQGASEEVEVNQEVTGPSEVEKLTLELANSRDRYLRLMADFDNFKKRALKEQSELLKYQGERLVVDLLEVLDTLELALAHSSAEYEQLKTGLEMTQKLFVECLGKWDIRGELGLGKSFDPQKHAAISRVPSLEATPGEIVAELRKAYFYKDKLIRVGEVVVAVSPEEASA